MCSIPYLLVDAEGRVVHTSDSAARWLDFTKASRVWNLLRACDSEGNAICGPGCSGRLLEERAGSIDRDDAIVRGEQVRLVATPHDELVVVSIVRKGG
jgi:hypothetical protein